MRPVSDAFLRTLRGSHKMFARAKVLVDFQDGVSPTGTEITIIDGDVRADASSDIRTSLEITTSGDGMWPLAASDLLAPYGNEIFVERGIDYGNGTIEIVSLGYFRINSSQQDDGPNGQIHISADDRMSGIIDARLTNPVQFAAGTSLDTVFDTLVLDVYPNATITYDFDAVASEFDTSHIAEEDRFGFLNDVAKSRGKIMYWNYAGELRLEDPPNPSTPVFDVDAGRGGVMVNLARSLDRRGVYNAVVATGETPGDTAPVQAIVVDDNPNSPTFWDGRFGHVPRFYYSSFITTVVQATSAARSILQQATGLPYSINFTTIANPALEPYDPIKIKAPDTIDIHVIDSLTIPLTAQQPVTGSTRKLISFDITDPVT